MSSFAVSALCALSMCYTPSQLTRQSSSFVGTPDVQRIVAGSTYQIAVQGSSFTAGQSWTLSSTVSDITSPTCTYQAAALSNQCIFDNTFTASTTAGTTITYTAHNSVSNTNVTFSMITEAAVPAQPSLAASNETHYVINSASNDASCILVSAPSSRRYEATALPATWTGVWTDKPEYVSHAAFTASAESHLFSGLWSTVAAAGVKHDFHAVCYNIVGRSMAYSVYNYVAVDSEKAPAAVIVSSTSTTATSFQVTFQSPVTRGLRGFYPDNATVLSDCRMAYGRVEASTQLTALSNGVNYQFVVSAVDLSIEVPFTVSCVVAGVENFPVQGRIAAVSTGLSSSSGSFSGLSSSSAPAGYLSSSSDSPVLLSSSSAGPVLLSSSSASPGLLSSSSEAPVMLSSSSVVLSSTGVQIGSSSVLLSTGSVESSSSVVSTESSSVASSTAAGVSSAAAVSSSSSSSGTRSASSSAVVSPVDNVPEGTVSVTFGIDIPEGGVTPAVIGALHTDISANIAAQANKTTEQIKPFVIVTVGTMTSANRRLLSEWVAVSFMVLGNITTVTGGQPGAPFNALAAATSVTTALSAGTFVSTETAAFGVTVPQQSVEVLPVIPSRPSSSSASPVESSTAESSSSSAGFGQDDDSSSSGLSDGAIAGAVVGSILGAIVLLAIVGLAARSGAFNKCMAPADPVTQANANDIHNKGPLPIGSFEENVEVGYPDQPVRIHTDSPVAAPMQPNEEMVYSNGDMDANEVQVTIETRE